MENLPIYVVSVEVEAMPGSEMWGNAKGAFLYCLVPADGAEKAIEKTREALTEDSYKVLEIEEVIKGENMDWESIDTKVDYAALASKARQNNDVVYGPFFTYEAE